MKTLKIKILNLLILQINKYKQSVLKEAILLLLI